MRQKKRMAAVIFVFPVARWTAQAAARPRAVKAAEVCWFQHIVLALAAVACVGAAFFGLAARETRACLLVSLQAASPCF